MNRRSFLQLLSTGALGAATLDVDQLLWLPGQKTIFLHSASLGATPLTAYDPIFYANEGLTALMNSLNMSRYIAYGSYDAAFPHGDTITIRVPKPSTFPTWRCL